MAKKKSKKIKVGILVECGRDGLEIRMCRRICELFRDHHDADFEEQYVPLDNKKRLIEECATAARDLFVDDKCDRVVILWDERPAWPQKKEKLCWSRERRQILAALEAESLRNHPVFLVCIEREFESWLMFDERLLSAVLSTPEHPVKVKPRKNPDRMKNPKSVMMRMFKEHGRRYVDVQYATRMAKALEDLSRFRKCASFRRFAKAIIGKKI